MLPPRPLLPLVSPRVIVYLESLPVAGHWCRGRIGLWQPPRRQRRHRRCPRLPHCRKPVAAVAWLVPPAAASVATPEQHADNNLSQYVINQIF
jgi:hypothetical protein